MVCDIAFNLGFSSEAHFSRIFRRAFGLSPSEVRARAREVPPGDDGTVRDGATASGGYEDWVRRLRSA